MKQFHSLTIAIVIAFVTGCAASPGMRFDEPPPGVEITPITADLIAQLGQNAAPASKLSPELLGHDRGYEYLIRPNDVLNITVWDHPELTIPEGQFRGSAEAGNLVAEDGTIFFPHAGVVQVDGKTIGEVRDILTKKIARVIQNPQLDVRVAAYRSQRAYVTGEVATPGQQPITDIPLTIINAITTAGGRTEAGDLINVTLKREGKIHHIDVLALYESGDAARGVILRHGDLVHVPNVVERKIFVLGEVDRPQSIVMNMDRRTMTLTEAIGDVGGVDRLTSRPADTYVFRGSEAKPEIYWLDAKSPAALILGEQFLIYPRDVVYVDTAGVTRWNRVISQILPTANLLRTGSQVN